MRELKKEAKEYIEKNGWELCYNGKDTSIYFYVKTANNAITRIATYTRGHQLIMLRYQIPAEVLQYIYEKLDQLEA